MARIGIVGAGVAAAGTAFALSADSSPADVTVFEKSGGVGGRAATRRHGDLTYEYGANYVKSDDERVANLLTETLDATGLVDVREPIYTFDGDGRVSPGRDADDHRWTYSEGLTQLTKRLFARTDATVHRRTPVRQVARGNDGWTMESPDRTWGPFDALVLTPPAPQTADLLCRADWDSPVREQVVAAAADVPYRTVWTAVLHYPFELDVPYYGLVNPDKNHDVGWIAREECKPGHVPPGESLLVVQAGHDWSAARFDRNPSENAADLARATATVVGDDRIRDPHWWDHQGWRYALPASRVDPGPLPAAEGERLYCAGDWVAGEGRVHAALANGLECGDRLAGPF